MCIQEPLLRIGGTEYNKGGIDMEILARHYERDVDGSVILVDSHTGEILEKDDIERKFIAICENEGVFSDLQEHV